MVLSIGKVVFFVVAHEIPERKAVRSGDKINAEVRFSLVPIKILRSDNGAGTSPAGLAAVQDKAGSKVPTLGYGVSYAVGNLLLALWGTVLVIALSG